MARIKFDLEFWKTHPDCKVETRDGKPARIVCTDLLDECEQHIVALVQYTAKQEKMISVCANGEYKGSYGHNYDLFIVTDEPELSAFEQRILNVLACIDDGFYEAAGMEGHQSIKDFAITFSKELLSLAREQLIHEGYIIEKKAFHDAVEKVEPEVMKEVEENVDKGQKLTEFEQCLKSTTNVYVEQGRHMEDWDAREDAKELLEIAHKQILAERKQAVEELMERCKEQGKAEALKDLPRWKKLMGFGSDSIGVCENMYIRNGYGISLLDLDKLPKEEL